MNDWFKRRGSHLLRRVVRATRLAPTPSEEAYVRMAYLVLLRREIDSSGLNAWREIIASGRFTQQNVIDTLLSSEEYLSRFGIDVISILHRSRQEWIRTVPAARRVLDIGGSSTNDPRGALIELGYPHRPEQLHILDLPPEKQYWGKPKYDQSVPHRFDWGEVRFFHGGAEDMQNIQGLQDERYDMIFLGQAIEHVWPDALPGMLAWIRNHLAPGGRLVFDTPNRLLTIIQCPDSLIDPDHKYEYSPTELERVVVKAGFEVTKKIGMVHLPVQAASGKYDPKEFAKAQLVSPDVDACYLFAVEARVSA